MSMKIKSPASAPISGMSTGVWYGGLAASRFVYGTVLLGVGDGRKTWLPGNRMGAERIASCAEKRKSFFRRARAMRVNRCHYSRPVLRARHGADTKHRSLVVRRCR